MLILLTGFDLDFDFVCAVLGLVPINRLRLLCAVGLLYFLGVSFDCGFAFFYVFVVYCPLIVGFALC